MAFAHRAFDGMRAGRGARALAGFAGRGIRYFDTLLDAFERFFERDCEIETQIGAALLALRAALAPAAQNLAEHFIENIGEAAHAACKIETAKAVAAMALRESGMAEAVIGRAAVGVREDLIGLADFLE